MRSSRVFLRGMALGKTCLFQLPVAPGVLTCPGSPQLGFRCHVAFSLCGLCIFPHVKDTSPSEFRAHPPPL